MTERKESVEINTSQTPLLPKPNQLTPIQPMQQFAQQPTMQSPSSVPQASPQPMQAQQQGNMTPVMQQAPQPAQSPHNMQQPSTQFYVQSSLAPSMQAHHAIAPAPGPQATTTSVSALHHLTQQMNHPAMSPSPMPQFPPQLQVIQGSIPSGHYVHQVYQNAQGQFIMPSNVTLQTAAGMGTQMPQGALNSLNPPIQVITAGKPFQGQIAPHMIAGGKNMIQAGSQPGSGGYNPSSIPTTASNQTVLISQLSGSPALGVISSQPPNILPAQSTGPKPGEVQKVNNMQTFGQIPQSITWGNPGTLQSPALLAGQNQLFIRGPGQPAPEGIFIHNQQPQQINPQNSMVQSGQPMQMNPLQNKTRTGLENQPNIQPKVATMRPPILPSINPQLRPGASVSTQTAVGQTVTQQMSTPRPQGKGRSKNTIGRTPTIMPQGHAMLHGHQVIQPHTAAVMPAPSATSFVSSPGTMTLMASSALNIKSSSVETTANIQSPMMNSQMQSAPITISQPIYAKPHSGSPQPLTLGNQASMISMAPLNTPMQQIAPVTTTQSIIHTQPHVRPNTPQKTPPKEPKPCESPKIMEAPSVDADCDKNKSIVNGTSTNVNKTLPNKAPPKAMVKPQLVSHVIDGYVIHEASQPFPVSRTSRLNELSKDRQLNNNTATVAPQVPQVDKENDDSMLHKDGSPKEIKCEICGKIAKFKKSKRFCSSACMKRARPDSFAPDDRPLKTQKTDNEGSSVLEEDAQNLPMQLNPDDDEPKVDILKWTVKDVVDFIQNLPGCQDYAADFELQEIDGQALMLLKADHLMSAMSIKLGPALKICDKIEAMRADKKEQ